MKERWDLLQRIHIICHPKSGSGRGQDVLDQVTNRLHHYHIPYFTYKTQNSQSIDLITKQVMARKGDDFEDDILIIGGDGTLHDAIESLVHLGLRYSVAYIPAGTGNDFGRLWLKGRSVTDIVDAVIFDRTLVQVPIYHYHNHVTDYQGIVLNSMGFGLDAITNLKTQNMMQKLPSFLGKILNKMGASYILGLLASLGNIPRFQISVDNGEQNLTLDEVSLATIVNNPYFGAGIQIDNLARIDDDQMSLIAFHHIDVSAVMELIPRVLIHHNQDQSDHVTRLTGHRFRVQSDHRIQAQVDGESFIYDRIDMSFDTDSYPFIGILKPDQINL